MFSHADSPIAPPLRPEAYRAGPAVADSNCELCRDGWPRIVGQRSGRAFHELPEPAGSFKCFLNDPPPPMIHSCHHVEKCSITAWIVATTLVMLTAAILFWPQIKALL